MTSPTPRPARRRLPIKLLVMLGILLISTLSIGFLISGQSQKTLVIECCMVQDSGSGFAVIVNDNTRSPVAGVQVHIQGLTYERTTLTDTSGAAFFLNLVPDSYTITAIKDGYREAAAKSWTVTTGGY